MTEYAEILNGSLYVACHVYCINCISDINTIREKTGLKPLNKIDAYWYYKNSTNKYSPIELLNAGANCFEHRTEWGITWPTNLTTRTLESYSITYDVEFPLNVVSIILQDEL